MNPPRNRPLDILRAVAIFLVLGRHMPYSLVAPAPGSSFEALVLFWRRGGWVGVDLFFVLSGFLVSGLLFREYRKHMQLGIFNFYFRRQLKIFPNFYLFIVLGDGRRPVGPPGPAAQTGLGLGIFL